VWFVTSKFVVSLIQQAIRASRDNLQHAPHGYISLKLPYCLLQSEYLVNCYWHFAEIRTQIIFSKADTERLRKIRFFQNGYKS
jgi:hypothetical protein